MIEPVLDMNDLVEANYGGAVSEISFRYLTEKDRASAVDFAEWFLLTNKHIAAIGVDRSSMLLSYDRYEFRMGAFSENRMVGLYYAQILQYPFCEKSFIEDGGMFVDSQFRGIGIGKRLFEELVDWAKQQNVVELVVTPMTGWDGADDQNGAISKLITEGGFFKICTQYSLRF